MKDFRTSFTVGNDPGIDLTVSVTVTPPGPDQTLSCELQGPSSTDVPLESAGHQFVMTGSVLRISSPAIHLNDRCIWGIVRPILEDINSVSYL